MKKAKLIIIGSGPAGYTAAIYAARANLNPALYAGFFTGPSGGQLMTTTDVENFPGFPEGISGPELVEKFLKQAERFGTLILPEDVDTVDFNCYPFLIKGKKTAFEAESVIIATGATAKRLDIPVPEMRNFGRKGSLPVRFAMAQLRFFAISRYLSLAGEIRRWKRRSS